MLSASLIFRITIAAMIVTIELIRAHFLRKSAGADVKQAMNRSRLDTVLTGFLSVSWFASLACFIIMPEWLDRFRLELPLALRLGGVGLGALSIAGLVWVHRALDDNFSSVVRIKDDHHLVCVGPYRWVRHPMYTVFYALAASYFLISANLLVGLTGGALILALTFVRIPVEERQLLAKFGDEYRVYQQRTGSLFPKAL